MLEDIYNWKNVKQLNDLIIQNDSDIKYVLIIPKTINFQLLKDLNQTFKHVFEIAEYMDMFQKSKCYVLYLTLFTLKEKNELGPIADDVSFKIIVRHLLKILKKTQSDVQIVGPNYLKPIFKEISYDSFLECFQ